MLPKREKNSHKGQNGRVLVVGGNEIFHGAPVFAALGAEKTGVDLIYLVVPKHQQNLPRRFSLNLIVDTFKGKFLRGGDIQKIVDFCKKADVMVIGNGAGEKPQTLRTIRKIIERSACDLVLDAAGLIAFADLLKTGKHDFGNRQIVLTPHRGEFGRMIKMNLEKNSDDALQALVKEKAKEWHVTLVVKTPKAFISDSDGHFFINETGDPIMTKGGTGDVLAGIIAGFMAQKLPAFEAAKEACFQWGKVGEYVAEKIGTMSTTEDLLKNAELRLKLDP